MPKFAVGEVAIINPYVKALHPDDRHLEIYAGEEVTITSELMNYAQMYYYEVTHKDGIVFYVEISELRKKKPPQELTTWEEVQKLTNWDPTKIQEHVND